MAQHGWPVGPLALLRGFSDVRRRLEGSPLLPFNRTAAQLAQLNREERDRRYC